MRHFKILLVALAITTSTSLFANTELRLVDENSVSAEIENLLDQTCYEAEKDLTVTVFFSISEDNKIQSLSVASSSEGINEFLQERLSNQDLSGNFWKKGKIYELSVTRRIS